MTRNRVLQHPDEYRKDLNPEYEAGENRAGIIEPASRTAFDIKDLHDRLPGLRDDQLKQIPIVDEGARLQQGAVYFDLRHPERGELKALGSMEAGPDNWYVPKSEVDYELWNLLIGIEDPYRLGRMSGQEDADETLRTRPEG